MKCQVHHNQIPSVQSAFASSLVNVMKYLGKPFRGKSTDLVLDSKEIAHQIAVKHVNTQKIGLDQFQTLIKDCLIES